MWNDEIKENIIRELNEQFNSIAPISPVENHSYSDSIFSPTATSMFKPIDLNGQRIANYYEATINKMRELKEIPVHTIAFSDSFNVQSPNMGFAYSSKANSIGKASDFEGIFGFNVSNGSTNTNSYSSGYVYDMNQIINNPNAVSFSITPEQRNVALVRRSMWKDILFNDVSLIKNTNFADAIRKFCSIQIKF